MKNWIEERIAWIDRQFPTPPSLSRPKQGVAGGAKLQIQAADGDIYYTTDGSDPRAAGGNVSRSAQPYTEPIVLEAGARLFARVRSGNTWSGPATVSP